MNGCATWHATLSCLCTAAERLLRRLGLPSDPAVVTELRLIVELLLRGAVTAAAAMMETHLESPPTG